jgi:hypothetical protein
MTNTNGFGALYGLVMWNTSKNMVLNTWPPRVSSHLLLHLPFLVSYWTHEPRYGAELGIA